MVSQLNAIGIPIRWERVKEIAGIAGVGRPHVARAMIELGVVRDVNEAFDQYLGRGKPGHVERMKLDPADAVRFVRSAGGVPVLAHPFSVDDLRATLNAMIPAGLLGLEAYYQDYTLEERESLANLAANLRLLTTVGSESREPAGCGEGCTRKSLLTTAPLSSKSCACNRPSVSLPQATSPR